MLPLWTEIDPSELLQAISAAATVLMFVLLQVLAPSGRA